MKTLTVKELIQELNKCPKDLKVFISSDTEGNSFGTIDSYEKFTRNTQKKKRIKKNVEE